MKLPTYFPQGTFQPEDQGGYHQRKTPLYHQLKEIDIRDMDDRVSKFVGQNIREEGITQVRSFVNLQKG